MALQSSGLSPRVDPEFASNWGRWGYLRNGHNSRSLLLRSTFGQVLGPAGVSAGVRRCWPGWGCFAVNLIVPLFFGLMLTDKSGRFGMFLGVILWLALGCWLCFVSRRVVLTVVYGGWVVAAFQFWPSLHFLAGAVAIHAVQALGQASSAGAGELTSEPGGFLATVITGGLLLVVSGVLGLAIRGIIFASAERKRLRAVFDKPGFLNRCWRRGVEIVVEQERMIVSLDLAGEYIRVHIASRVVGDPARSGRMSMERASHASPARGHPAGRTHPRRRNEPTPGRREPTRGDGTNPLSSGSNPVPARIGPVSTPIGGRPRGTNPLPDGGTKPLSATERTHSSAPGDP